jgi:hypothetical protein
VDVRARLERARSRFDLPVLGRIAQSALAAGAAWELALQIPGHGQPFFAPIAAVIALGADRGRRGRQAIGVTLGILLGAGIVAVAGVGAWQIVLATAIALVVATAAAAPPVIRIQAAASAILVVALHRPGTNLAVQRLVDALIGGGIAIVLARLLFPIDPLELVRDEARQLRVRVADALEDVAAALAAHDRGRARAAHQRLDSLDERRLEEALALARDVVRAAPRRRPLRRRLEALGESWKELEASVADARAIATGALRLLGEEPAPAPELVEAVRAAAAAVRTVDPEEARATAEAARAAAARVRERDASLGASVVTHGVIAIAEHALRAAAAREEDTRLAAEARRHKPRLRGPR